MSIAAKLQPFVDARALAGAVTLVASAERTLDHGAVGFADLATRAPMRPDSLFWIASISKPITATAVMMLVEEGKIDVERPVEDYLPEFRGQQLAVEQSEQRTVLAPSPRPITVREVLSHTSGLPFMSRPEAGKIDRLTLREAALTYALTALTAAPGSRYSYSNAGTNTAGRIVEVASGMPFWDFLRTRLIEPLGMVDTTFWPDAAQQRRLAKTYKPTADKKSLEEMQLGQCTYPLHDRSRQPSPAGGLFSTAADLARFARMILRGGELDGRRYLRPESIRTMASKQTGALENNYGFCWDCDPATGLIGHGGAYATDLRVAPRQGLALIYLVQHAGYGGEDGAQIQPTFRRAAFDAFAREATA